MVDGRGSARSVVRRSVATVLGVYGHAVLGVADLLAPTGEPAPRALPGVQAVRRLRPGATAPAGTGRVDARTADIAEVRRAALEAAIAATADPSRPAAARFAERVDGLSEWGSGRVLDETERMRQAAVAVVAAGSGDGHTLSRRQFDPALRRQFPWLDDVTAGRLYDHAVLVAHRIRQTAPPPQPPAAAAPARLIGSLVGRFRSR